MAAQRRLYIALIFLLGPSAFCSTAWGRSRGFYRALAQYHAPVIVQGIGTDPRGDVFTRIDFDGDANLDNSWKHLRDGLTPAVYYDVMESATHYFINYDFYYPRDYAPICFWWVCHENDFEGMRITVTKTADSPFGKVALLETLAHNRLHLDNHPAIFPGDHPRVIVTIEGEGHGVHPWSQQRPDKHSRIYVAGTSDGYELVPLARIWALRGQVGDGKTFRGRYDYEGARFHLPQLPQHFAGKKWGKKQANPAWGWKIGHLRRGDWFFDPIHSICEETRCPKQFGQDYLYNSYFEIGTRDFDPRERVLQ